MSDNPETIMKELRVDWEEVISPNFNPLHLALKINKSSILSSEFREMFHKLEFAMENIIAVNFKGFSDSVLSYNEFNKLNKECIRSLKDVMGIAEGIKKEDFDIKDISAEKSLGDFYKIKYDICVDIQQIKHILDEFDSTEDIFKKSHMIIDCLDLIDNKDYIKIKGVDEYRKIIYMKYLDLANEAINRIVKFIFKNKMDDIHYFKVIKILGSLHELEIFFEKNFRNLLFNEIESTIVRNYRVSMCKIEELSKHVINKIESIKNNMSIVISKAIAHFAVDPRTGDFLEVNSEKTANYFGKKENSFKYCSDMSYIVDLLKKELSSFIEKYSNYVSEGEISFDLGSIVDNINYGNIYGSSHPLAIKLSNENKLLGNVTNGYSLVVAPDADVILYLLKYSTDYTFKSFLNKKIESSYDKYNLENGIEKMEFALAEFGLKINAKTGKLAIYDVIYSLVGKESNEYIRSLKTYINGKIHAILIAEYDNIFKSEIVKSCRNQDITACDDGKDKSNVNTGDFKNLLIKKHINKKDLFLTKQKYQNVISIISTLRSLDVILCTNELKELYRMYFESFKNQLNLDFFYFYDLMFRQGNYRFYIKSIVRILKIAYEEAKSGIFFEGIYSNMEFYSIRNVNSMFARSKDELSKFIEYLRILDEIMGELEFHSSLSGLYKFYDEVLNGESKDEYGKILIRRISG